MKRKLLPCAAVLLTAALAASTAMAQRPLGIDVSSYQGSGINWSSVKGAGRSFAWAKATESTTITDADFAINENNGKAAGVYMGAYHFAHPNLHSPASESGYFWGVAGGYIKADGKTLMPMLDMEVFSGVVGAGSYSDWANQWNNNILNNARGAGVNIRPAIYTSACSACNFDGSVAQWLSDIADYNGQNPQSGTPWSVCGNCAAWGPGVWTAWQYSSTGSVPGVAGNVDSDVYNGNSSQLFSAFVATSTSSSGASPNPAIGMNSDGRLEIFGIWSDSSGAHAWQTAPNAGWSPFISLGGGGLTKIAVARNLNGTMEAFCVAGNIPYHTWWTASGWSGWYSLGGGVTDLGVATNSDGRLELFATGTDGAMYHNYQLIPNGATGWSGWGLIGGSGLTRIVVGTDANGSLEPFAIGGTTLFHSWNGTGGWVPPQSLGGSITDLTTMRWPDGRLEVFGVGTGGDMQHNYQLVANGSTGWSGWFSLGGGGITRVSAQVNLNGSPELFVTAGGGTPYHNYWTGNAWSGWISLGGVLTSLTTAANQDGHLEIFGRGTDGSMYHNYQLSPNGGAGWSGWFSLGGSWK